MKFREIKFAFVLSCVAHVVAIASFIYFGFTNVELPLGDEYILVDLVDSGNGFRVSGVGPKEMSSLRALSSPRRRGSPELSEPSKERSVGDPRMRGDDSGSTSVASGSKTGNPVLAKIRSKIERNKLYPKIAEKMGIEGSPVVKFNIDPNGTVANVELAESSGEAVLDTAALETVKRAEPLPYYDDPIKIKISYKLANR